MTFFHSCPLPVDICACGQERKKMILISGEINMFVCLLVCQLAGLCKNYTQISMKICEWIGLDQSIKFGGDLDSYVMTLYPIFDISEFICLLDFWTGWRIVQQWRWFAISDWLHLYTNHSPSTLRIPALSSLAFWASCRRLSSLFSLSFWAIFFSICALISTASRAYKIRNILQTHQVRTCLQCWCYRQLMSFVAIPVLEMGDQDSIIIGHG